MPNMTPNIKRAVFGMAQVPILLPVGVASILWLIVQPH